MKVNRTCQRKQVWTFDEDKELFELVNQFGENGFWYYDDVPSLYMLFVRPIAETFN